MTLQQIRYFLETCRTGSFTAAADALYIAQPSVAQQVRQLEEELGVRLFVRTGRRLELTPTGVTFQTNAQKVMEAMAAMESSIEGARDLEGGSASLGTFGIAQRYLVNDVVTAFAARYPNVTIRVIGQHSSEVIEQVRVGELEAGLVTLPVDQPSLVVEPVTADEIVYTALPGADTRQPMSIERLAEIRLITWPAVAGWRDSIRRQFKQWAEEAGVVLKAAVEVEHIESALDLAALGIGGTYVPRTIAESSLFPAALETVRLERPLTEVYAFIRRRDHRLSPASAELVRLAREQMETYGKPVSGR